MSITKTVAEIECVLTAAVEQNELSKLESELSIALAEALGVLHAYEGINIKHVMYDMARLAGHSGHVPDDFDGKATKV